MYLHLREQGIKVKRKYKNKIKNLYDSSFCISHS